MARKYNFAIGDHSECCWAKVEDDKCTKCGADIHYRLSSRGGGRGDPGRYIQAFAGMYRDSAEKKVRLKVLGKCYKIVGVLKAFQGANISPTDAMRRCVAKYGANGIRRKRVYHIECKSVLTFNVETGRLFSTNIYGKRKTVIDCSYGSPHLRDVLGKFELEALLKWMAACVEERKDTLPRNGFQINMAWANFPTRALLEQKREMDAWDQRMVECTVYPIDMELVKTRPVQQYDLVDEMRRLFMILHFPNLGNTNMPLTCKFFDYNRKLYATLRTESKGTKLVKALFKHSQKPIIEFLRKTAAYGVISDLSGCFGGDAVVDILSWKGAKKYIAQSDGLSRRQLVPVSDTNPSRTKLTPHATQLVKMVGEKRAYNQFKKAACYNGVIDTDAFNMQLHYLLDGAYMLERILKSEGFEDYKLKRCSNLKEIHDRLSATLTRIARANKVISYSDKELEMELEIDGYTFVHPKETHDLITIGEEMNICVGGYDIRAYNKTTNITVCVEDSKFMLCIEHHNGQLIQVKANNNGGPTTELRNAVTKWCAEVGLDYQNCYDMRIERMADVIEEAGNMYGRNIRDFAPPAIPVPHRGINAPLGTCGGVITPTSGVFGCSRFSPDDLHQEDIEITDLPTIFQEAIKRHKLPEPFFNNIAEQEQSFRGLLPIGGYKALLELSREGLLIYEIKLWKILYVKTPAVPAPAQPAGALQPAVNDTLYFHQNLQNPPVHPMIAHLGLEEEEEADDARL